MNIINENEVKEPKYQNVPLDKESYQILESLCAHYGLSKRSKGAFVSRLLVEEKHKVDALLATSDEVRRRRKSDNLSQSDDVTA